MENKFINTVIYDIETLKNCFTACFLDYKTNKRKEFVIHSSRNDFDEFIIFLLKLKKNGYYFVGFNNLNFDSQVIQYIFEKRNMLKKLCAEKISYEIYKKAQEIINQQNNNDEKFSNTIPELKQFFSQIDLFKQKHYDGAAKRGTSLKWIEFTTRFDNIEEMPIHHNNEISSSDIPVILGYNWNDVEATKNFFDLIHYETELRFKLSEKYNLNLLNASEPRLAKEIFAKFLSEDSGMDKNELKKLKTIRSEIPVKDILFPYINFETEPLQNLLNQLKNLVIDPNNMKNSFDKTFIYHGIETVIGLGGIHACCNRGIYESSENWIIHDKDVTSFYPNLSIQNNLKPAHLGKSFTKVYNSIFEERKKIPKTDPVNYIFKIILNSCYGLSNEINSYLYDPLFTMSITINGQLLILKLVEMLSLRIPDIVIYQENTDGITIGYTPDKKDIVKEVSKEWEKLTNLELEDAYYKKMVIMDVNNYIAQTDKNKLKRKGLFAYDIKEDNFDYHKNHSFLIIQKALQEYFINGTNPEKFIYDSKNIFDFLGAVKTKSDFNVNLYFVKDRDFIIEKQQKICRYYISNKGGKLIKDFKDKRQHSVHARNLCTIANRISSKNPKDYDINYTWYIGEVKKIINLIENIKGFQTNLFDF